MPEWELTESVAEMKNIQIISEIKYDDYQQYTHGMRYIESLALWLRQFKTPREKQIAYEFIKNQLIYVSEEEMRQLVMCAFSMKMEKYIMSKTKDFCTRNNIADISERKNIYFYYRRCCLFLGLSDGAHMDFFRRQNKELSNEQVIVHYDFSSAKAKEMRKEFTDDEQVKKVQNDYNELGDNDLNTFFLVDDFSGSGRSFIRFEEESWHGKIDKFINVLTKGEFNLENAEIHVIIYISTEKSLSYIKEQLNKYVEEKNLKPITIEAIQKVKPMEIEKHEEFVKILKKNYDNYIGKGYKSFEDKHFEKGQGKYPYLGFSDCALPVILFHNTPNNSLPVLWYTWEDKADALFPRVTRHKEI